MIKNSAISTRKMIKSAEIETGFSVAPKVNKFESFKIHYMDELLNEAKLKNNFIPPRSPPPVGTDKIRSKSNSKKYLIEYASASTVHGLKHLIAPRRHIFEKLLVVLAIVGSLGILIVLSIDFWDRYQNNPTVIVIDHEYRMFNVTKPAFIMCPEIRVDEEKFPEVFQKYNIPDNDDTRNFFKLLGGATYENFDKLPEFTIVPPDKWIYILYDLKPLLLHNADDMVTEWVITERGVCLAMRNYVSPYSTLEYWSNDNWTIIPKPDISSYTYQTREIFDSLKIKQPDVEITPIDPGDVLSMNNIFYDAKRKALRTLTLLVAEITSSQQVRDLSLTQRKCKLNEEKGLKMWPIYTHAMCASECRYTQIYKICQCHPHFARPMPGIPTCNTAQLKCIADHLNSILLSNTALNKECNCYPDCDIAGYMEESTVAITLKEGSPDEALLNVPINFPKDKYKRELLFGFNDFLASVGGGAGLFLGASVISFIEVLYFGTLRLFWYKIKLYKEKKKKQKVTEKILK